jgi:DNA-binding NtrC family response regulator
MKTMNTSKKIYDSPLPPFPVMVVDDEEAILFSIDTVLRMAGINNIITCSDGREVMNILSSQKVEIMLLDLSMPYFPGEELLAMVTDEFPEIPVVIVTATANEDSAVRCMKSGAFDYVVKPLEEGRLISAVNQALSYRKLKCRN